MSRDVSDDLAKLCGLAGAVSVAVAFAVSSGAALVVSVGMLGLLTVALVSPAGPTVLFDEPQVVADE